MRKYNSMSDAGRALAMAAKKKFMRKYPSAKVGIKARDGWITVDGKKAVNMSSASSRPMSIDEVISGMESAMSGRLAFHASMQESRVYGTARYVVDNFILENADLHRCMDGTMVDPQSLECHDDIVMRIEDAVHQRDSHSCGTENRIYYNGLLKGLRKKRNRLSKHLALSLPVE